MPKDLRTATWLCPPPTNTRSLTTGVPVPCIVSLASPLSGRQPSKSLRAPSPGIIRRCLAARPPRCGLMLRQAQHEESLSYCESSPRSEEHTSELQSLMRISYAVFCLKKKKQNIIEKTTNAPTKLRVYNH